MSEVRILKVLAFWMLASGFLILVYGFGEAAGQPAQNAQTVVRGSFCTICHSDTQAEFQQSVHSREGLKCEECHGGDPHAQGMASAHSKNFRGSFDRRQITALCSSCHSDPARMKPYGIPTDQYALYLTSVHGRKLMQGDRHVAVCTDCHEAHRVLPAGDPKSPVYRENVPQTCGRCHENADLMKGYNRSPNVVSEYLQSVHAQALLRRHNRQAPECTRCHGTHGAAPPGIGDVGKVCGQCHSKTLESFRRSPHQTAMAARGIPECTSCHGDHRVEASGHDMWSSSCTACHEGDSPASGRGRKLQAFFVQAEDEIQKAYLAIEEARRIPTDVSDYEARLSDAQTSLVEARPVSHSLSIDEVEDLTRRARSIALEVQSDIHKKVSVFRGRVIVLILIWFYILTSIAVIFRYRRALEERAQSVEATKEKPEAGR